jgi:nitric oxide reductase NorE protein
MIAKPARHIPGEIGIWVFILGDMTVFALLFATFAYYRAQQVQIYLLSQAALNRTFGLTYTLLLLTSSWVVALGIDSVRKGRPSAARPLFAIAFACGASFVIMKCFEYSAKVRAGITPMTNDFYSFYYILTGLHLMHVLVGMIVLLFMRALARTSHPTNSQIALLECGATYWHMVDALWIVLFPLFYLMK